MCEKIKWDEKDAIEVLKRMKWPPMQGDSRSTTHLLRNISLDMAIAALREKWVAKQKLKED